MTAKRIQQNTAAGSLTGDELVVIAQASVSVTISAATISAAASDNSYNDSGSGFVAAGFAEGDGIDVSGFTGSGSNNSEVAIIVTLTAGKMIVSGPTLVDDAAGETVTIARLNTARTTTGDIAALGGGGSSPLTTKGDVYTYSTVDARLAVGSNRKVLRAASAQATGLEWAHPLDWFDVKTYGALGDNSTDDTAAIQAAIDACETAGGGTVYFPAGIYVVGGALQDTSRSNSQLLLPRRHYLDTKALGITLRGAVPPGAIPSVIGATPLANTHSILRGTLNTASGTSPSMIGAWGPSGSVDNFTNILLKVNDLGFSMPANPALTACNFSHVAGIDLDNVLIEAGSMDVAGLSAQTTAASFGLMTPANNNGAYTRIGALNIIGFYNGMDVNEHCTGQQVSIWGCKVAATFRAANHGSYFARLMTVHCQKGLVFVGGIHNTTINQYDIEHAASGTWVSTNDIDDASNYSRGFLRWHTVLAGTGADNSLVVNGAAYLTRNHPQTGIFILTDGATITPDLTKADNFRVTLAGNRTLANPTSPFDGQTGNIQVIQDGTGTRTLAYGTKWKFPGGAPVLSTAANSVDVISYIYDATSDTLRCAIVKALA